MGLGRWGICRSKQEKPCSKKQEKIASQNSNDLLVKFLTQMLPIAEVEKTLTLQEELKLLKESEKLKNHEGSKFRIKL